MTVDSWAEKIDGMDANVGTVVLFGTFTNLCRYIFILFVPFECSNDNGIL